MTRPLRYAHAVIWVVLPLILLALMALGIVTRLEPQP